MKMAMEKGRQTETEKLFNFRPLFFVAVFLCLGILFAYFRLFFNVASLWRFACLLPIAGTPFFLRKEKRRKGVLAILVLVISFLVGEFAFIAQVRNYTDTKYYYREEKEIIGVIAEKSEYEENIRVLLEDIRIGKKREEGTLAAYLPHSFSENLRLGDKIFFKGSMSTKGIEVEENPYWAYNVADDIRFQVYEVTSCEKVGSEFSLIWAVQQKMVDCIYAGMDKTTASVSVALLIGDMSGIEEGLMENIRYGGIAHVFSVSGLNVGALYLFCVALMKTRKLKNMPKMLRFVFVAAVIFLYTGVCGFSSSVVRASIICLIAYATNLIGIRGDFLEGLGFSAIVILLFSPVSLFDVGFQLSFSACLGLALVSPFIDTSLQKIGEKVVGKPSADEPLSIPQRMMKTSISFIAACIASQIATAPIQINAFGYLSGWSLLLNCLFVPIFSVAFSIMLLVVAFACLLPMVGASVLLYLPSVLWSLVLLTFQTTDFSSFALTGVTMGAGVCICYYFGWLFLTDKWNIPAKNKKILAVLCFVATTVALSV